jgi:imidazolonepropionase-like amidohydrolase
MKNKKRNIKNLFLIGFLLFAFHFLSSGAQAQIAVRGETIWTMAGEPIQNGIVLINGGKIEAVGTANQIKIPANYRILTAKTVTPGLIDAHSVVGLAGYMNQPNDQMQVESSAPMQPELRAIDAYNTEDRLIEWIRSFGITTIHTGHAPAALSSGQTMIAKTFGKSVEDATITPTSMIAVTLGESGLASGGKSPGTVSKAAAMLRAELIKAQSYGIKPDSPRDLRAEMWKKVINREISLLVTAHKARDIMTALRIAKEFNIKIVLDGASEAQTIINEIKTSGFPVIIHPTLYRAGGETEGLSMVTASKLKQAGILVAMQSGYETYVPKTRVVLFEAAVAAANGLSAREALATVTIDAARILGIANRVGSIEKGKDADLAMYDGDPFEYMTHCTGTIINGQVVSEVIR